MSHLKLITVNGQLIDQPEPMLMVSECPECLAEFETETAYDDELCPQCEVSNE